MAIRTDHTDPHGVRHQEGYWKVTSVRVISRPGRREAQVEVGLWHDRATRDANLRPVLHEARAYSGERFDTYFGDAVLKRSGRSPTERAYAALKQEEPWGSGADV